QLPSGQYAIWMEADDQNGGPVRVYAPTPVTINHVWPTSWQATIRTVQEYRALTVGWDAPTPDADQYRLSIGTNPKLPSQVIEKKDVTTATIAALEPGKDYYLTIEAFDSETGRSVRSQQIVVRAMTAEFLLTTSAPGLTIRPNQTIQGSLVVNSNAAPYPDAIGLSVVGIPDGLSLLFAKHVVTPTAAGAVVTFELQSNEAIAGGHYSIVIAAVGGGVSRQLTLDVTIQRPSFTLSSNPNAVQLSQKGHAQVTLNTAALFGSNQALKLRLDNAPAGLDWSIQNPQVTPGQSATLLVSDTELLAGGVYSLTVLGDDGSNLVETTLRLTVNKPAFALTPGSERIVIVKGESITVPIQVGTLLGWNQPITLALESSIIPSGVTVGFAKAAASNQNGSADVEAAALQPTIRVTAPDQVALVIQTSSNVADEPIYIQINASSGLLQKSLTLELQAKPRTLYLPMVAK
ncbi:MAG: fibronectin type III domain-containing protein, partial [Caldilineaceae bacterium]